MADVFVALDVPEADEALELVDRLGDVGTAYKVGLELYTRAGPDVVRALADRGKRVFLDLKLHDIPHTVGRATAAATALGVELLTVHVAGGREMLRAAREAAEGRLRLAGVTVLTSLTPAEMEAVWGREIRSVLDEVRRFAELAGESRLDGVVASALEAAHVRRAMGADFLIVTPGIRPAGVDRGDQKRVATPAEAVAAGADVLVVGRAVTRAADPVRALEEIAAAAGAAANEA